MDWETQKKLLLQRMEADLDDSVPEQAAERLQLEDAIQITDQAIALKDQQLAEKNQEIEELRELAQPHFDPT